MQLKALDTGANVACITSQVNNGKTVSVPAVSYVAAGVAGAALVLTGFSAIGAAASGPRTRRSGPPRCSRRPRASSASPPEYTMSVAQRLYENSYITYMRTDSVTLSQTAVTAARKQARELYGDAYVPDKPRTYASKVEDAEEAHEATSEP